MKYVKQFGIIMAVSFSGEVLKEIIPLPVPANIYGLMLMLTALMTKVIKLSDVKETAYFMVNIIAVMFIPAGVGIMNTWGLLKDFLLPAAVITLVTTLIVMGAAGRITQFVIRREREHEKKREVKRGMQHEGNDQ